MSGGLLGGWNRFGYVGGNPLSFTDPLGQNTITGGAAIGGSIGGLPGAIVGGVVGAGLMILADKLCKPDDCHKANKWELRQAGITDEHKYKTENGAIPNSHFDICKCKDGSIRIAKVGQCGKTNNFWD